MLRNGRHVMFQTDRWLPFDLILSEHAIRPVLDCLLHWFVFQIVDAGGGWCKGLFESYIPFWLLGEILGTLPPQDLLGEDRVFLEWFF